MIHNWLYSPMAFVSKLYFGGSFSREEDNPTIQRQYDKPDGDPEKPDNPGEEKFCGMLVNSGNIKSVLDGNIHL